MVIKLCVVLLFVGCALANPLERRSVASEDRSTTDQILEINEESDVQGIVDGDEMPNPDDENTKRSISLRESGKLWLDRVVYYDIDPELAANQAAVDAINGAITLIQSSSCITFTKSKAKHYINFMKGIGCWSYVGRVPFSQAFQNLSVGTGCEHAGIVVHELYHALGFWHEQSRFDRDSVVEILWENIQAGKESNFEKQAQESSDQQQTPYDEDSIMMYGNKAFSANGKDTIKVISEPTKQIGQRASLSPSDVLALNRLYFCNVTDGSWSYWTSYSKCDANCKKFRSRYCTNANKAACDASKPDGVHTEEVVCPDAECHAPRDGHWARWSAWTSCTKTCDDGTTQRTRTCTDPAPVYGGADCSGSNTETVVCNLGACNAAKGDCTFDNDAKPFCDWTQDAYDDKPTYKDWMRGVATPSGGTGPSKDHSGNGKFIYMEASDCIHTVGKYVRLLSTEFPATGALGRCIKFWYNQNGATFANFNVYIKASSGATTKIDTVEADNTRGDVWTAEKFHFTHTSSSYFIILESECGLDYRSDFAVDDIVFNDGACPL